MKQAEKNQWKIVTLPRLQIDTLVASFLLKYFGENHFPGIKDAVHLFWVDIPEGKDPRALEAEGYIFLDIGGGAFDHHIQDSNLREKCTSEIVAEHLGVHKDRSLYKLLEYARRDDLFGKGIISKDPIDRAFGLSGLLNNLNRSMPDDPEAVLRTVMPLFLAHYIEEKKRAEDLPKEFQEKLNNGKAYITILESIKGKIKMTIIETDEIGMAGYLRAQRGIDIVVQKMASGHVNIITQQKKALDLSQIAKFLRMAEIQRKNGDVSAVADQLDQPGRVTGVEEWYFDPRARTVQNGGIRPQWTAPTGLSLATIEEIIKQAAAIKL